jgi:hypothetical protein
VVRLRFAPQDRFGSLYLSSRTCARFPGNEVSRTQKRWREAVASFSADTGALADGLDFLEAFFFELELLTMDFFVIAI